MRLPKKVDLGLAIIHVQQVSKAEMRSHAECEADEETPDGLWDPETDSIYLLRGLPGAAKRRAYWHEIKHAVNDADYWGEVGLA